MIHYIVYVNNVCIYNTLTHHLCQQSTHLQYTTCPLCQQSTHLYYITYTLCLQSTHLWYILYIHTQMQVIYANMCILINNQQKCN